ncbi:MAG: hypothetical protein AB8H03_08430 [Saprospiraceae bacterium]
MKNIIFLLQMTFLFFLSFSNLSFGQLKHEIKIDALSFLYTDIQFSYEYLLDEKSGVKIDFRFMNDNNLIEENLGSPPSNNYINVNHKRFMTQVSYNEYLFSKREVSGLALGGFARYIFYTKIDDQYPSLYENRFMRKFDKRNWSRIDIGGTLGWKFVFAKRIVIEPSYSIGLDLISLIEEKIADTLSGLHLNVGYRF